MLVFPNAKINLGLDILSRRPDGYHNLSTVMVPVAWRDALEIVPSLSGETTLTVTGRRVDCPPEKNLVMRAYRVMAESCEVPPVEIYLRKIVPDGAGLGGGSADAAFTLTALNSMFSLGLTDEAMAAMAARLGADCPLFVFNRPMLATGTGTELSPIELRLSGMTLVIVKPPVSVPTAQAYSRVTPRVPEQPIPEILQLPVSEWQGRLKNDFEKSVFPLHPMLPEIKAKLLSLGAVYASMSGSGSALYGLFESDILAETAADTFRGCQIFVTKML